METKRELKILAWIILVFAAVFFLPLDSERFQTAIDATLDLAKWYAREHVILCLLPAFFIAGVIAVFVSQGSVLKYFGANAKKWLSYSVAAISGGILAVCSCTILPLFTSIYKRGAGLGPAIAFLYSGPAISILSIILTARILGLELGIARTVGAILFSVVIGLLMSFIFRREERAKREEQMNIVPPPEKRPMWQTSFHFFTLVLILVFANWGCAGRLGPWCVVGHLCMEVVHHRRPVDSVVLVAGEDPAAPSAVGGAGRCGNCRFGRAGQYVYTRRETRAARTDAHSHRLTCPDPSF